MEVTTKYQLPFKSEYDWRTTLFHHFYDYFTQAAVEIILENEPDSNKMDWNNHGGILEYAVSKDYFSKIGERARKLAAERVEQDS